jgi:sulfopyruvate decarboxylase alpha subunit
MVSVETSPVRDRSSGAQGEDNSPWASFIYDALMKACIRQITYVPDAGHARLIEMLHATPDVKTTVLTTEEEGVALAAGAWLGGERAALLMQSSGVGNCVNMLSLLASCRFPFLTIVTMRGEWREFNPWQIPMGHATPQAFEIMGVGTIRVDRIDELSEAMASATTMAFESDQAIAVLLSQRLLTAKKWV